MPTDFWFRFSTYLALAISCACLGYAEWELLPAVSVFAAGVIVFLALSFWLDRKFELSLGKANLLGLVIGIGASLWLVYSITNPPRTGTLAQLGWPTSLLPVVAPVLMVLIPAKLLRPMHVGDWWAMYGVSLAAVGLASSMNDDATFVVLLVVYSVVSAWSLVLFFYRRGGGFVAPIPNRPVQPPPQVLDPDLSGRGPRWMFARSTLWLLLAGLIALPLFFTLPRPAGSPWLITKQTYEIGQSIDSTVDLSRGGTLQQSDEVAYVLFPTEANGEQKTDLPPELLWRARALCDYKDGAWSRPTMIPTVSPRYPPRAARNGPNPLVTVPTDFGDGGFQIEFVPMDKERYPVLASPVGWVSVKPPVYWVSSGGGWNRAADMSYLGHPPNSRMERYRQACGPLPLDGLGQPFEVIGQPDVMQMVRKLDGPNNRGAVVREYANALLGRLIREGKVPASARLENDPRGRTAAEYHERIARLFSDQLASSGEFTYDTTITFRDKQLDPVEDFLKNTRNGNCELFATALAMLLRAVDVPAQYVTGYKGWDVDEDGNVVIRRGQAHAWVEVLVSRPPPPDFEFHEETPQANRGRVWHWLSLDPTTPETNTAEPEAKNWLRQSTSLLFDLIVGYDKEKQKKAIQETMAFLVRYGPAVLIGLVLLAFGQRGYRRWRRQVSDARHADPTGPEWYGRLLRVLEAAGHDPLAGETPREFADRVSTDLFHRGVSGSDVPPFVASKLYRVRYAGHPLEPAEVDAVVAAIDRLEQALRLQANGGAAG